ncbi:extracellular solute-binding protein [Oceanomicrobium pacificus]|uniref:Extracellular solute-binding protein n=1 Tax=Oceanomicrobium pacificus TaxID=2692916 RepID=A0A6B0TVA8_9RHOB|nr:extracellular solute-binding protein [Oceanomicrobium pacificus]MXU65074.1 extracellular solute-binding protein [Oceanomicrobium pacificus]
MKLIRETLTAGLLAAAVAVPAQADTVEFMNWTFTEDSGRDRIQALMDNYAASSDHEVEAIGYAWSDINKNAFLRARTNTLPDVMQVQGRFLPTIANIDQILDLNEVFGKDALEAQFPPGFLAMGQVDGKQVALPWIAGTIGMVANKQVLEAAGVDGIPETVEEFRAALEKVRDTVPNSVPYGMATKNNNSILLDYLIWAWTFGADVIGPDGKPDVNSEAGVAAIDFMVGLMNDRLSAPEIDRPDARRLFGQEATAFYFDAPSAKKFAADFSGQGDAYIPNVMPMETPTLAADGTPAAIQWGHVLVMFGDDNASGDSAAAGFVQNILSDEVLIDFAVGGGALPPTTSALASDTVKSDAYLTAWAEAAVAPRPNPIAPLSNGGAISDMIGEEVQAALLGQKSPQEAADDLQARLEEALE